MQTNLEWLIEQYPTIIKECLSRYNHVISVDKNTGFVTFCDTDCENCIFSDNGSSHGCVERINAWLEKEHKEKKQVNNLTEEDFDKICANNHRCCDCSLQLKDGYCFKNIKTYIKEAYDATLEELMEFAKKTVEV